MFVTCGGNGAISAVALNSYQELEEEKWRRTTVVGASALKGEQDRGWQRQVSVYFRWGPEHERRVRRATAGSILVETRSLIVVRVGSDHVNGVRLREMWRAIA
ncbi:MAG: hypothetical protein WAK56_22940, partial [Candidatus Sulfotelmatobacter sp.]